MSFAMLAVKTCHHGLAPESVFVFNLNNPLDSHTGEGRYPAMKNTPRITSDLAGIVCQLSRMAITNDLPSVFRVPDQKLLGCWVSQMASSRISSSIRGDEERVIPIIARTDGASAEFPQWRFNIRGSNTEPLLRLNVETRGDTPAVLQHVREIEALIRDAG